MAAQDLAVIAVAPGEGQVGGAPLADGAGDDPVSVLGVAFSDNGHAEPRGDGFEGLFGGMGHAADHPFLFGQPERAREAGGLRQRDEGFGGKVGQRDLAVAGESMVCGMARVASRVLDVGRP
jgi:hypothetical protein